jgi:sugar phosphate isomerase/epimerase
MKIVCSTLPLRDLSVTDALQRLAQLGLKQVELCTDPRHSDYRHWNVQPQKIVQQINRLGININSIHVPSIIPPQDIRFEDLQKIHTAATLRSINLAADLNAAFIVQHIYRLKDSNHTEPGGEPAAEIIPDMRKAVAYAAERRVQIAVENAATISAGMVGAGVEEVMAVVKGFTHEHTGICLDVTHCVAAGIDPLDALETIDIHHLISIHASDNFFDKFKDQHLAIGSGDIAWKKLFQRLNTYGFRGTLVVEVADESGDGKPLIESIEYLRNLEILG